jgi:hypothetical protein
MHAIDDVRSLLLILCFGAVRAPRDFAPCCAYCAVHPILRDAFLKVLVDCLIPLAYSFSSRGSPTPHRRIWAASLRSKWKTVMPAGVYV